MPETVDVELTPNRIEVEPGAKPVEATVGLRNLGNVVSQFTIEVADLEPDWFTVPVPSVGLFPQDREQVRITFHPPKRPNLRAGTYPFRVLVRGRGGVQEHSTDGILDVRGFAVYRLDMTPRRQTHSRDGVYKLQVINSGTADVRLELEARDDEDACDVIFPKEDSVMVEAGTKGSVPFVVKPRERPWFGPEKPYGITVTARPQDARGSPQSVSGQYTHKPLIQSWGPLWTVLKVALVILVIVGLIFLLMRSNIGRQLGQRYWLVANAACVAARAIPAVGTMICWLAVPALAGQGQAAVAGAGGTGGAAGSRPPQGAAGACEFQFGFKEFHDADPELVGTCVSSVSYDVFGNGFQNSTKGVLVWQKGVNTIYYLSGDKTYALRGGRPQVVAAPGT